MPQPPTLPPAPSLGDRLELLVELMRILRSPDGCPWDREQTLTTLRPFVLEESYEVLDAIDAGDMPGLCEELGDYVFEAVFIAQLCAERGDFSLEDSLAAVADKLVRRHPHVFEEARSTLTTSDDVKRRWEEIKAGERRAEGRPAGLLSGIPAALPGLLRAYRMGRRAATVGFDWDDAGAVMAKVQEELSELQDASRRGQADDVEEELGDVLFAVVNLARHLGVEPENALRRANTKFARRFTALEDRLDERGVSLRDATAEELDAEWQRIKADEA